MTPKAKGTARTLADLPVGGRGCITSVEGSETHRQRLLEMGLTEGTEIEVVRFAPLGDPMEIRVRGYLLTLRRHDALGIRLGGADHEVRP